MTFLRYPAESREKQNRRRLLHNELLQTGSREAFSRGEFIVPLHGADDKVRMVRQGYIKVFQIDHNGTKRIITFLGEGSMLGPFSLCPSGSRVPPLAARASSSPVRTICWDSAAFGRLVRHNPYAATLMHASAADNMQLLLRRFSSLAFQTPRMRVGGCLLELAEAHGRPVGTPAGAPAAASARVMPGGSAEPPRKPSENLSENLKEGGRLRRGLRIPFRLTQADLAHMAAVTRPTAGKVMRGLRRAGVLGKRRGFYEIYDVEALARMLNEAAPR